MTPAVKPVEFRPLQGTLHVLKHYAHAPEIASLLGLEWGGNDGVEAVIQQWFAERKMDKPIPLSGPNAMTPRQMAEDAGFIKKARPHRRLKK